MKKQLVALILLACLNTKSQTTFFWAKSLAGNIQETSHAIEVDGTGNVYTTGEFEGTVDFNPGGGVFNLTAVGSWDGFISKLDNGGNFVWAKQIGGAAFEGVNSIKVDGTSNIYTTGSFQGTSDFDPSAAAANLSSMGGDDAFITKWDASGNYLWAKSFGGPGNDIGASVIYDATGNVYCTGTFSGTVDFDPGAGIFNLTSVGLADVFILKLDGTGSFVWAKSIGSTSFDNGNSISLDASNNVYTTGYFRNTADFDPGAGVFNLTTAGSNDAFILKLSTTGVFVWAKQLGGISSDNGNTIGLDAAGNVYTTGYFSGSGDFDPNAGTFNLTSNGGQDVFISKLDASGNFVWAKNFGGTGYEYGVSKIDVGGSILTTGSFDGTADFDPGTGTFTLAPVGSSDVFISKLDALGNLIWANQMGGTLIDNGTAITSDGTTNVYTTGTFEGTADLDPTAAGFNLTAVAFNDIFIQVMGNSVGMEEFTVFWGNLIVNPNNGKFDIQLKENSQIIITNVLGQDVLNESFPMGKHNLDIQNQPNGLYFVKVLGENTSIGTQKIIKQ